MVQIPTYRQIGVPINSSFKFQSMELDLILKIICMVGFFCEVVICGKIISKLSFFENKNTLSLALSFSGGLFLSIALIHILPDATHSFNQYFQPLINTDGKSSHTLRHQQIPPYSCIICAAIFILVFFIDKVVARGGHDHQYQLSFINQPRKKEEKELEYWESPATSHRNENKDMEIEPVKLESEVVEPKSASPFVLQAGMSIHAFFECLAVGLQTNTGAIVSLAIAIFVHKWAQGLTLGLIYQKNGYRSRTITFMILLQGIINVLGLVVGTLLKQCGDLVTAIFLSISAGTFLYISTVQVLPQQMIDATKGKILSVFLANLFISGIFFIQKI